MIHLSEVRREMSLPFNSGKTTSSLLRPLGLDGKFSQVLATSGPTSNGPTFTGPWNAVPRFSGSAFAVVRSPPPRSVLRSAYIFPAALPSNNALPAFLRSKLTRETPCASTFASTSRNIRKLRSSHPSLALRSNCGRLCEIKVIPEPKGLVPVPPA